MGCVSGRVWDREWYMEWVYMQWGREEWSRAEWSVDMMGEKYDGDGHGDE